MGLLTLATASLALNLIDALVLAEGCSKLGCENGVLSVFRERLNRLLLFLVLAAVATLGRKLDKEGQKILLNWKVQLLVILEAYLLI